MPVLPLALLLLVAFGLGGGGSSFALANLAVQLTAIAVLAFHRDGVIAFWRDSPLAMRGLIAASLLLPLLQIIPLPASFWTALPGRDLVERSLELTGGSDGWRSFSLNPLRTLLALTALITPLAVIMVGWKLPGRRLLDLGWLVVGLGLVTTLLGTVQLGSAGTDATLFGAREPGTALLGTFANRNSAGLLLGFALGLAALLPTPRPHPLVVPARLALCALLLVAIILTKSRTALVLAMIPLGLAGLRALLWALNTRGSRAASPLTLVLGALALLAASTTALLVSGPGRISETMARFEAKDDPRRFIWEDATYAAGHYWPVGAGMGTFDEIFQVDESLENLTFRRAGRAHNDYIELAIEAGIPGLILAVLWIVLIGWLSWRVRGSAQRWPAWAASGFLLAIALQSISDYPLRSQTILAFAGFALLLLVRIGSDQRKDRR